MNYSKYEFTLNLQHTHSDINIPVLLGDTLRRLYITLRDGERKFKLPNGSRAVLVGKKPDSTLLASDCVIESNESIRYDFSASLTSTVGAVLCEIRIEAPDGELLTTPDFCVTVQPRTVDDGELEIYEGISSALEAINAAEAEREAACAEAVAGANAAAASLNALIEGESYIPTIGDNGNWWVGGEDTGKSSVGESGAAGPAYTLTESDKAEITESVLASLPTWEGGSY